ncbi:hypothetical protein CAF53_02340 [Sphingobium sp. LB126]|uniref:asparagine synthase-related protein n=1 Tax=Sphingobium sp. LB126 TaxID=1983755 RepID=UPI000C20141C|nr:asparagine synthase-related protein [Sphingobium sp. LB126]PJG47206.1 hypothetical protein CAF53_02340 [Sphingobium sp. LB126]
MMHRFLAAVLCSEPNEGQAILLDQLRQIARSWTQILDTPIAQAWVIQECPSALGFEVARAEPISNCTIGWRISSHLDARGLGAAPLEENWGAYVSIEVDAPKKGVTVYRDPTGRVECWYIEIAGVSVLFSHLADVLPLLRRKLSLNWDYLEFHLFNRWLHNEATGYNEITELLPGQLMHIASASITRRMKWRAAQYIDNPFESSELAGIAIRAAAQRSISEWASRYGSIALDLSGGLDSAIVLGLLRDTSQTNRVIGVNYFIPHIEGDERDYAHDAASLHKIDLFERSPLSATDYSLSEAGSRILRPSIRTMPLGYDQICSKFQSDMGVDAFFTGTGGDHLFYDFLRPDAIIDYYNLNGLRGIITGAHQLAQVTHSTFWSVISSLVRDELSRSETALDSLRRKCSIYLQPNPYANICIHNKLDIEKSLHPEVLEIASTTTPAKLTQVIHIIELQKHYWRYGRADTAEEVHPLFSQPLIEASLRTHSHWFCQDGFQRGLARSIFRDLLPDSIANRRFKGSNTSHWLQMLSRQLDGFRSMLLDGELAGRGVLDEKETLGVANPLGLIQSANFGAFINTLSVEQWIQQAA